MFRAIVVEKSQGADGDATEVGIRDLDDGFLTDGDVIVDVSHSSINFKDGMLLAGRGGIGRTSPLIPGIDLVGTVSASESPDFAAGDLVTLNGAGMGESRHGGLAERARVDSAALVRVPDGVGAAQAAAIGTAGFTAMLSVLALEKTVRPGSGDVLVTGAAGGVGSVAIAVLAGLGYRVIASTGRVAETGDYLRALGAADVIDRDLFTEAGKPMQSQRFAGAVDSVGSHTLANIIAQTVYGGTVTACGLAQGPDLPGSVLPFILRAVSLVGINSVDAPPELRAEAWRRLATDLDLDLLDSMTSTVSLADAETVAPRILAGRVRGRTVVDVRA
ncbi:MDR family oxidoreductase [Planctomonas psychrotolerans]|uniref:MDR family oxidoreductase n=1 Tax=Planctomonas psychrotolerans TaxID=2528712 RepID=UPI0012398E06|nr:MDR family oxidoreductase [Planctomonas psychrotolerans]